MNLRSKVNFSHNKFNYYMGGMGDVRIPLISWKRGVIKFDLCCKRGKKIYKQLFKNEFYAKEEEYDKYLFYKLKELLIMLERTIEHGYITGFDNNIPVLQIKLTKNYWVEAV